MRNWGFGSNKNQIMIASVIGKTLLAEYNRRQGTGLTAEQFFDQVFHPVFYGHARYLQWVTNCPFVQGYKKSAPPDAADRAERLKKFKKKVHSGNIADASYAIGFPATGVQETTSGQVSNMAIPLSAEDIYASWIGGGLGIGVQGGFSIYFNHPEILWQVYEGWAWYRNFVEDYDKLRSNQIDTWNGQWFSQTCNPDFNEKFPVAQMHAVMRTTNDGGLEFSTQRWTEVAWGIARRFKQQRITGYICSLGQTNTTIGFIPFELPALEEPFQFYQELFGENEFFDKHDKITQMFGTAHSFRSACQKGAIGVPALEPKDLTQYMTTAKKTGKMPDYAKADDEKKIAFKVYQSWLMAMLNKKEYWQKADEAAQAYHNYIAGGKKANTMRTNVVNKLLESPNKRLFIESTTALMNSPEDADVISAIAQEVDDLPDDNFRYFLTLIKFRFAYWKIKKQGESE